MGLAPLLTPERVLADLTASDKETVIHRLCALLAADLGSTTADALFEVIMERERLSTTGIGHGIAVPHGRLAGLTTPIAALARIPSGVDFAALDGEPVHLVILLLSPLDEQAPHLQALATISQTLLNAASRERLLAAGDRDTLHQAAVAEST